MGELTTAEGAQLLADLQWRVLFEEHVRQLTVRLFHRFEPGKPVEVPCMPCWFDETSGFDRHSARAAAQVNDEPWLGCVWVNLRWYRLGQPGGTGRGMILAGRCERCGRIYYQPRMEEVPGRQ